MENTYKAWVLSSRQQLRWKLASGITFDPIHVYLTKHLFKIRVINIKRYHNIFFIYIYALILTKALQQRVYFSIFAYSNQSLIKRVFFSFFALTLTKARPQKGVLIYFCPYSNQSSATKGAFHYFCPYSNQSRATKSVFLYCCHYSYKKPCHKWCFFSLFLPLF